MLLPDQDHEPHPQRRVKRWFIPLALAAVLIAATAHPASAHNAPSRWTGNAYVPNAGTPGWYQCTWGQDDQNHDYWGAWTAARNSPGVGQCGNVWYSLPGGHLRQRGSLYQAPFVGAAGTLWPAGTSTTRPTRT